MSFFYNQVQDHADTDIKAPDRTDSHKMGELNVSRLASNVPYYIAIAKILIVFEYPCILVRTGINATDLTLNRLSQFY